MSLEPSLQPPPDATAYNEWVTEIVRDGEFPSPAGGIWWYEYGVQWPKDSDYEGDGWFITPRLKDALEELETAPEYSILWKRLRIEWRGPELPPRAWRIVTSPWVAEDWGHDRESGGSPYVVIASGDLDLKVSCDEA